MTDTMSYPDPNEEEAKKIMSDQVPFVLPDLSIPSNQGAGFGPAVDGVYLLKIIKPEFMKSSNKGTPGLNLELDIASGEYVGKKLWDTLWLTEKANKRLSWFLRCLGSNLWDKNLSQIKPAALLEMLTGSEIGAKVGIESYIGTDTYQGSSTYGQQITKFKNIVREYVPKNLVGQATVLAPTLVPGGAVSNPTTGFVDKSSAASPKEDYSIFLPKDSNSGDEPPLI